MSGPNVLRQVGISRMSCPRAAYVRLAMSTRSCVSGPAMSIRAGVLTGATGPRGGFRLARPADQITMLDVVEAVDGATPFYTCNEIRQKGRAAARPEDCRQACGLAAAMAAAETAWRRSLSAVTIADIVASLPRGVPGRTRELLARPR